jgi:peptidoglycan/LPS O-acetylase OafA/YrhL
MAEQHAVRWRSLDGMRGVAAMVVVLFHVGLLWGGYSGVPIFFVLSGCLITYRLLSGARRRGRVALVPFWVRRVVRLMPPVLIVLAVVAIVGPSTLGEQAKDNLPGALVASALYIANFRAIDEPSLLGPLLPMWTLAIEEQFYLLWPPVLALLVRARASVVQRCGFLAAAVLGLAAWRAALIFNDADLNRTTYGTDMHFDALLLGCLLGVLVTAGTQVRGVAARLLQLASVATVVGFAVWLVAGPDSPVEGGAAITSPRITLLLPAGAALVIAERLFCPGRVLGWVLESPPLQFLGRISYSLYLVHLPLFAMTRKGFADMSPGPRQALWVALAVVAGAVLHFLVEGPCMKLKDRIGARLDAWSDRRRPLSAELGVAVVK